MGRVLKKNQGSGAETTTARAQSRILYSSAYHTFLLGSLPPSLPHPCQSVAELKDSQLNLAGEIVAAYLVGNGLTPSFFHNLGRGGWGRNEPSYIPCMLTVHVTGPVHLY